MTRFLWILGILLLLGQPVRAESFTIALANMPPFAMGQKDDAKGILVDIAKLAFQRLGHDVHFVFYPWPRAVQNVKAGRVDAIMPFFKTPERETFTRFVGDGLVDMELHFFRRKGMPFKVETLEAATPYRIIKVDKANLGNAFDAYQKDYKVKVDTVPNTVLAVKVLASGRVDLFASVKTIAEYAAQQEKLADKIEPAGAAFDVRRAYLSFSAKKTNDKIIDQLVVEIAKMKKNGDIKAIYKKYRD